MNVSRNMLYMLIGIDCSIRLYSHWYHFSLLYKEMYKSLVSFSYYTGMMLNAFNDLHIYVHQCL